MSEIKYLLDENVNPNLRKAMHQQWPEIVVWIISDPGAPSKGTLDPDILVWCEANDFSLVTNNRTSIPQHLEDHLTASHQVPGIFIINSDMTIGETAQELALIWGASGSEEYRNLIHFLPVSS